MAIEKLDLDDSDEYDDDFGIEGSRKNSQRDRTTSADLDSDAGYLSRKGSRKDSNVSYGAYDGNDEVFLSRKGSKKESTVDRSNGERKASEGLSRAGSKKETGRYGGIENLDLSGLSRKGSKK